MPAYDEMQRDCSKRLVAFAKHAKLAFRLANFGKAAETDKIAALSYTGLRGFLTKEYIPLAVYKLQGDDFMPLAENLREEIEKIGLILDACCGEKAIESRRQVMKAICSYADAEDYSVWLDGERLNDVRNVTTRSHRDFTDEDLGNLAIDTSALGWAVKRRVSGISTLYEDDTVDNVSAFYDVEHIVPEINRQDDLRREGVNSHQLLDWDMISNQSDHTGGHIPSRSQSPLSNSNVSEQSDSDYPLPRYHNAVRSRLIARSIESSSSQNYSGTPGFGQPRQNPGSGVSAYDLESSNNGSFISDYNLPMISHAISESAASVSDSEHTQVAPPSPSHFQYDISSDSGNDFRQDHGHGQAAFQHSIGDNQSRYSLATSDLASTASSFERELGARGGQSRSSPSVGTSVAPVVAGPSADQGPRGVRRTREASEVSSEDGDAPRSQRRRLGRSPYDARSRGLDSGGL